MKRRIIFWVVSFMTVTTQNTTMEPHKEFIGESNLDTAYIYSFQALEQASTPKQKLDAANNLLSLGNSYFAANNIEKARTIFQHLVTLFPSSATLHHNLAYCLNELTLYHEAIDAYKKTVELNPDFHQAWYGLATALLATGDYASGWQLYERRWNEKKISLRCPRWDGISSLHGKKIILLSEGGLGDCIQFIRYAKLVKKLGAFVSVHIPKALKPLMQNLEYIDQIYSSEDVIHTNDYYTSLLSLPALFHTTLASIPCEIPYIKAQDDRMRFWSKKFDNKKFNIGVCSQADPANDANRPALAQRSFSATFFEPLVKCCNTRLYDLQMNATTPSFIISFGPEFDTLHGAFIDTVAVMHHLDLVITVDTSIAHISGALGIPTLLILPFKADWRWLENADRSPWYPTMTIIRKEYNESWESVINRSSKIVKKLQEQKGK